MKRTDILSALWFLLFAILAEIAFYKGNESGGIVYWITACTFLIMGRRRNE